MFFKKILDFKQDVENQFLSDENKAAEKIDGILDKRRYQISVIT